MNEELRYAQLKPFLNQSHHGINLPLFSLRSENSCGIGEFYDLFPLLDWMKEIGLTILQLLPLNDSAKDPSPYNAISSCAIHPIYLSLRGLPFHQESTFDPFTPLLEPERVPYEQVLLAKETFLKKYFRSTYPLLSKSKEYQSFLDENHYWLDDYALFKTLKIYFHDKAWMDWSEELQYPTHTIKKKLRHRFENEIAFHSFVQYLCFTQLKEVKEYANERNIFLKGDIPILISPDSCDVWTHTSQFNLEFAAGAPPDVFNPLGQYWGFPLFRWDKMQKDQFTWWKQRLHYDSHFYDIYRIDHIIGFFRIWAIPRGQRAIDGRFQPQTNDLVVMQGKTILEMMVESCPMLPIGEDLGILPHLIQTALKELQICGTKVIRWEKDKETNRNFIPFDRYPVFSMTSVSTHDSEPLALWWSAFPEEARAYCRFKNWNYTPELTREKHEEILWDSHHTSSLFHINLLQEYLALFPELSYGNPEKDRINHPGTISSNNWTYRFRPSVEEITSFEPLTQLLKSLIAPI